MIESDKTGHPAMHKGSALTKIRKTLTQPYDQSEGEFLLTPGGRLHRVGRNPPLSQNRHAGWPNMQGEEKCNLA